MKTVVCPFCRTVNTGANINSVCSVCGDLLAPVYFEDTLDEIKKLTTRFERINAPSFNSYNGIGTTLLDYRACPDGTYEATRWVIALFLPLYPLATYVIRPAGQERTYGRETSKFRVVARKPLTAARILRTYLLAVVGLLPVISGFAYSNAVNRALGGVGAFCAMILCFAWAFYIIFFRLKNEGAAYRAAVAA